MVAIFSAIVRRQPALFTYTMALGAVAWFIGNVIWLTGLPIFRLVQWWTAFLILTIVGERLELSRLQRLARAAETLYLLAIAVFMLGIVVDSIAGIFFPAVGSTIGLQIAGAGMVAFALWLLQYDIARRTVRQTGLTRFIAWCLLLGYVWLGIGGVLRLLSPYLSVPNLYDATLHTIFLGFVMSMIFSSVKQSYSDYHLFRNSTNRQVTCQIVTNGTDVTNTLFASLTIITLQRQTRNPATFAGTTDKLMKPVEI
jgi:hypothetical protein